MLGRIKKTRDNYLPSFILLTLTITIAILVVIPFSKSTLHYADAVGHTYSAKFVRENLFPTASGWNPTQALGYPHNQFYPPLFSWLVALLSLLIPLETAVKLIISLALLSLPLSGYLFARSLIHNKNQALLFTTLSLVFLSLPSFWFAETHLGVNIDSLFEVGFLANTLSLPLLLIYCSRVPVLTEKRTILPSILLALLILTHFIAGIIGVLYTLSWAVINKKRIKTCTKHYILSFMLTAFWSIPFVQTIQYSSSGLIPLRINTIFIGTILATCALLIYLFRSHKNENLMQLGLFSLMILTFILLIHIFLIGFHTYRLVFIFYILNILLFSMSLMIKKRALYVIIILAILTMNFYINPPFYAEQENEIPNITNVTRLFSLSSKSQDLQPQVLWYLLQEKNNIELDSTTYKESALHTKQINELLALLSKEPVYWGTTVDQKKLEQIPARNIPNITSFSFDLLGFDAVLTPIESSDIKCIKKETLTTTEQNIAHIELSLEGKEIILPALTKAFIITENIYYNDPTTNLVYRIETETKPDLFFDNETLYDELIFCTEDIFYFLRKIEFPEYNTYKFETYKAHELTNKSAITCINNKPFSTQELSQNLSHIKRYTNIPMYKIKTKEAFPLEYKQKNTLKRVYTLCRRNNPGIITLLSEPPTSLGKENSKKKWNDFVNSIFLNESAERKIYVNTEEKFEVDPRATLTILNRTRTKIQFNVDAQRPTPILVKISYFPNWRAKADNKEIEIYQASPHIILLNANGTITLEYKYRWYNYLGIILSLIGVIVCITKIKQPKNI